MIETIPLRYVAEVRVSNVNKKWVDEERSVKLCNYTDVYYQDVIDPETNFMVATATIEQVRAFSLRAGDILLTKDSETPDDIAVPAFVAADLPGVVAGYHLALVRADPSRIEPRFLFRVMQSDYMRGQFAVSASGVTRYGLTYGAIRGAAVPLAVSTIEGQRRVADFLDDQVSRIDGLICARARAIELMAERQRSVTEELVWGGVKRQALSPTGIGPAPLAPSHWGRLRNKVLLRESHELSRFGDEELLSVSHLTGVSPRSEKSVNMFMAESLEGYRIVQTGDLVINTLWAWMGALGVSNNEGIVSPAYGVYRPRDRGAFDGSYFNMLYRNPAYVCEMTRYSTGVWSSRLRLYPESFLALPVIAPPIAEQREIVREVKARTGGDKKLASVLARSMGLLEERKRALITAAVTGEFDVTTASGRGVA
jgi:type I restriction enzyme S subunit